MARPIPRACTSSLYVQLGSRIRKLSAGGYYYDVRHRNQLIVAPRSGIVTRANLGGRMNSSDKLRPGQRVWVLDPATGDKAWGIISRAWIGGALFRGVGSFLVVVLDGGNVVLNCDVDRRGERWDLAPLDVPANANIEA